MVEIKAVDVSKLRKITGAGMMDCKKALQESNGDFDKAIEIIRKKGQAIANKRADREASEGAVLAQVTEDGRLGTMVVLNCETDFVAKNEDFINFTKSILELSLEKKPDNLEELKKLELKGMPVEKLIIEQVGIIGEKIELAYYDKLEAESVIAYIHPGNKLATLVGFNKADIDLQVKKDVAMQVAAMNPIAIDKADVPQDVVDKELEIGREQAKQEGKAENILDKIAMGKLQKFFKENTLLNQDFIKDNKMTVKQYLESVDKQIKVEKFIRYTLNV